MEMQTKIKSGVLVFRNLKQDPEEIIFGEVEENDLSYWEFINNSSDSDVDDVLSISDASWHPSLSSSPKEKSSFPDLMVPDSGGDHLELDSEVFRDGYGEPYTADQEEDVGGDDDDDVEEEEEEEEEDGYDLDDELVPRSLIGKFGRQRIRKLGKRSFAKMNTSKKSPFIYMKPGCVHGKHGLGLKHSF